MRKKFLIFLLGLAVIAYPALVMAGEVDLLIEKLVEKGILNPSEARILMDETKAEVAKQNATGQNFAIPSWVQTLKVKGDVRLRYQWQRTDSADDYRARERIRYRLGLTANPHKDVEVGAGLASGSNDPRSTNQTLEDTFERPDIRLDYAYAQWQPNRHFKVIGGRFPRSEYLWATTDLLWDSDITPDGFSLHTEGDLSDILGEGLSALSDTYFNMGAWILDENGTNGNTDPFMHYYQAGLKNQLGPFDSNFALTYYGFEGVKGTTFHSEHGAGNNTDNCSGGSSLCFDYDSIALSSEIGINEPFGAVGGGLSWPIERISLFGDYVQNLGEAESDTGFALGFAIGNKKVSEPGSWQFKYIYAELERDAFLETFPDSDRLSGATDVRSNEYILEYALKKNLTLGLDWYHSKRLDFANTEEDLVQADVSVKF